tara:strand:+ start:564 stop:920 length:357 start_codon:yes stop_codon:yes gene_type:complete
MIFKITNIKNMKQILIIAAILLGMNAAFAQKKKNEKYIFVFRNERAKSFAMKVNYTKLAKKGQRRTKKGMVYLLKDGTMTMKKVKYFKADLGNSIVTPYYQKITFTSDDLLQWNIIER